MIKTYSGHVTVLNENQVFVFGSNLSGFHGAGSAGYASFNRNGNYWRENIYDKNPKGWKGKWNVKGIAEGFQEGTIGKSYPIPTVTKCGARKSRTPTEIGLSISKFYDFAKLHPEWEFLVAQEDKMGLNGYTPGEMADMYKSSPIPDNVLFEEKYSNKYL